MSILVQKYGGSSLADLQKVRQVAQKIVATREEGHDLVVVVSAMGDTTDDLLTMAKEISANPSRRELDMLLSVGERISMALMSIAIQSHGHEAVSLTGSQCGIITTHNHSNARIMDVRPFRVQDELEQGRIVIVAGYQGASYRRDVTTLGRGGSDTTAVALAGALGAEACEIYSDVDGVYSADPRVVLTARQLESLSYEEMQEMARCGARVLNEEAVEFARRAKIALYARSTHDRESRGTVVRVDYPQDARVRDESRSPAVAVSHIDEGLWVVAGEEADAVMELLESYRVAAQRWRPGEAAALFLNVDDVHGVDALVEEIRGVAPEVQVERAGMVSAVGSGIGRRPRWARMGRGLVEGSGAEVREMFLFPDRLSWVMGCGEVRAAAGAVHDGLVLGQ